MSHKRLNLSDISRSFTADAIKKVHGDPIRLPLRNNDLVKLAHCIEKAFQVFDSTDIYPTIEEKSEFFMRLRKARH